MEYFQHQADDVRFWTDRAHFEAEHGRAKLAEDRLAELATEFPNNPHVAYDQGLIAFHHTGQGKQAREFFLRASRLAKEQGVKGTQWFAARYLALLADNPDESRRWAEVVMALASQGHPNREELQQHLRAIDSTPSYSQLLWVGATSAGERGDWAEAACFGEISLTVDKLPPVEEAAHRLLRAQWMRGVDRSEMDQSALLGESIPPEDRVALEGALVELETALKLDPYDAVMWNFKAAWCLLVRRYDDAVECADRAIKLRPKTYPRPWVNKSQALCAVGHDDEALACAQRAMTEAKAAGSEFGTDVDQATRLIETLSKPRVRPTLQEMGPLISRVIKGAREGCRMARQGPAEIQELAGGLRERIHQIQRNGKRGAISSVPVMAQFLSDFSPEVAFCVLEEVAGQGPKALADQVVCMNATMYLVANSSGVQQRDAARFLMLCLLGRAGNSPHVVRRIYREAVRVPCLNGGSILAALEPAICRELARIDPAMGRLIADQEPLSVEECELGKRIVQQQFIGDPTEFEMSPPPLVSDQPYANEPGIPRLVRWWQKLLVRLRGWRLTILGPLAYKQRRR